MGCASPRLFVALAIAAGAPLAAADCPTVDAPAPASDFWVYSFGTGTSTYAPVFGSPFDAVDPDRMGYMLVVFEPAGVDPDALPPITSVSFEVSVLNSSTLDPNDTAFYDPTYDALATYLAPTTDTDPGRPIELYAVEFTEGYDLATLTESTSLHVPAPEWYAAQPVDFPASEPRRVMYNVDGAYEPGVADGFDTAPLAIAQTEDTFSDGSGRARLQDGARLRFEATLAPAARDYLTEQFRETGRVALIVSSLHAAGEFGMGNDDIYPRLGTKESFGVPPASLSLAFGTPADIDGDGAVTVQDLLSYLAAFRNNAPAADFDGNGAVNVQDLLGFLAAFRTGGC